MSTAKERRREEREAAENAALDAAVDAWVERQLAESPPMTWERWESINAIVGIKVTRREQATGEAGED
ncbi:hypothetical protein [Micromonospora sp. NPDC007230]|uniref:hypothetical protein n=1 Tax=Micromonospora sp. NPDC007230 TaxID=3364237 RepID=UPI00369822FE